jgi:fucose permease
MSTAPEVRAALEEAVEEKSDRSTLRVIGWFSVGMVVATVGIFLGKELFSRYKFNKRTPYDFYTNSDEQQMGEFGVGI